MQAICAKDTAAVAERSQKKTAKSTAALRRTLFSKGVFEKFAMMKNSRNLLALEDLFRAIRDH